MTVHFTLKINGVPYTAEASLPTGSQIMAAAGLAPPSTANSLIISVYGESSEETIITSAIRTAFANSQVRVTSIPGGS